MGRPPKQTVRYFSHDADASDNRTLSVLFNHFGHEGLSAWWLLLETLARTRNHYLTMQNGDDTEFLAAKMHFKPERLKEILLKMAELEAIDPSLFSGGIIWSQHFVDRLEEVYRYRKEPLPTKPELPIPKSQLSLPETAFPIPGSTQSIVEHSIVEHSIVEESVLTLPPTLYGEAENVKLTDKEYQKLVTKFGEEDAKTRIEALSVWLASTGKLRKSHYFTILNWDNMHKKKEANHAGGAGQHQTYGAHQQGLTGHTGAELKASLKPWAGDSKSGAG